MNGNDTVRRAASDGIVGSPNVLPAAKIHDRNFSLLNLLLFSVCGVHFGVDAGQVSAVTAYDGEQGGDLFWLHEMLDYGDAAAGYVSPAVVTIRMAGAPPCQVVIDSMEDITEFSLNDIHLFPALLEPFAIKRGMWGILPLNGKMVLLVDFQLLLKQKRSGMN